MWFSPIIIGWVGSQFDTKCVMFFQELQNTHKDNYHKFHIWLKSYDFPGGIHQNSFRKTIASLFLPQIPPTHSPVLCPLWHTLLTLSSLLTPKGGRRVLCPRTLVPPREGGDKMFLIFLIFWTKWRLRGLWDTLISDFVAGNSVFFYEKFFLLTANNKSGKKMQVILGMSYIRK